MGTVKQVNIKTRTYYFYNDIIDLENFDSSLLKLDKKSYKDTGIDNIWYITIKKLLIVKIFIVWKLYIYALPKQMDISRKWAVNKYLIFESIDENKELLKKDNDVFNGIMSKIKEVSNDECDYEKDYMKITFNSDDDLPLNKLLHFHNMAITNRSVFKEDGKLYPQVFLYDNLNELNI